MYSPHQVDYKPKNVIPVRKSGFGALVIRKTRDAQAQGLISAFPSAQFRS